MANRAGDRNSRAHALLPHRPRLTRSRKKSAFEPQCWLIQAAWRLRRSAAGAFHGVGENEPHTSFAIDRQARRADAATHYDRLVFFHFGSLPFAGYDETVAIRTAECASVAGHLPAHDASAGFAGHRRQIAIDDLQSADQFRGSVKRRNPFGAVETNTRPLPLRRRCPSKR